ncbi:MAG: hypothetical protein FWG44_07100 [Oscillospiraceae bacterium]|nr:hypothetical protein [Oscillospiraceae bacterium]
MITLDFNLEVLRRKNIEGVYKAVRHYEKFCLTYFGEGVISYKENNFINAIRSTDKILSYIKAQMPEETISLDLHKTQAAYILGFTAKENCIFALVNDIRFLELKKENVSELQWGRNPHLKNPNAEFLIRLLIILAKSYAFAENDNCWKKQLGTKYTIVYPDQIEKQDRPPEKFNESLRVLISEMMEIQSSEELVCNKKWLKPVASALSMINFLAEALSDCVIFNQKNKYYSIETLESNRISC